jgi:NADH dehydrogenase [ubiquinone] 1 alpha subcomplex assembly factor 7
MKIPQVMQTKDGIRVHWHYFLTDVPVGPSLYIGQEFLDAFPVHQFALTSKGWREKMVDLCVNPESPFNFRCVLAPGSTPASKLFLDELPSTSASSSGSDAMSEGDVIEVSPLAIGAVEDIARRISVHSGAALFVDYGEATPMGDTLRGFSTLFSRLFYLSILHHNALAPPPQRPCYHSTQHILT